jgi:SSS family solute:Na+ symporter
MVEGMHLHALDIGVFVAYGLAVMALGLFASRRAGGSKRDYFLAGDKLPWWMVGGSIIAANISSHHFVGIMGVAYTRGFVALTIAWPAIFTGFLALLWVFLPFYLRNGFYTVPEYLDRRFGGAARATYGALIFLTYVFVEISAVLYLGSLVLHSLFEIPYWWSIIGLAFFTGIYTITGGLRAVVWTEMLQLVVLIFGGATLSILTLQKVGGLQAVMATSKDWHLILPATDPDFPWTQYLGGLVCISVFYNATNQFIVQRALAAKDEWHARMGVVFVHYLQFVMPFIYIAPGLFAPLLFPNLAKGDFVFPTLVQNILPTGLVGLVMAGLMAAVMSHISGAINSCTTIATVDFYLPYINKNATDRQAWDRCV